MNAAGYNRYNYGTEAPKYEPKKIRASKEEYMKNAELRQEKMVREKTKRGREIGPLQVFVISVCMAVLVFFCAFYFVSLSDVKAVRNEINAARKDIEDYQKENALLSLKIEEKMDYPAVYTYATETLGMRLPEKQQVVTYSSRPIEYVVKSVEIPNE